MTRNAPARLGIQVQPQHAEYPPSATPCSGVEELGVDIVFNWDHFFPLTGDPDGQHFEAGPCSAPGRSRPSASSSARS